VTSSMSNTKAEQTFNNANYMCKCISVFPPLRFNFAVSLKTKIVHHQSLHAFTLQ